MSGPRGPRDPRDPGDWRDDEGYEQWPERDLGAPQPPPPPEETAGDEAPEGHAETAEADTNAPIPLRRASGPGNGPPSEPPGPSWDPRQLGERRKPTTAEQAVPWLVGAVLALAGIVIVLLALIFSDANGGFASSSEQPTPFIPPATSGPPSPSASGSPSTSPSPSVLASPTPTKPPTYGTLEMLYLSRPSAAASSELFRDDFATPAGGVLMAGSSADITHYAVASDGTATVALVNGRLIAVARGKPSRVLASAATAATFGQDAARVYAVRVATGASKDQATVTAISYGSGRTVTLTTISYAHKAPPQLAGLAAARFLDEGGVVRLYPTSDGNLVLWIANAGQWRIDPASGSTVAATRAPGLWSPDGAHQIVATINGQVTTLAERDQNGRTLSSTTVTGQISHLRWSPHGNRVAFTLGITLFGGGVRQDLYVWDLGNGRSASALTANGASFGVEWLGSAQFWQP